MSLVNYIKTQWQNRIVSPQGQIVQNGTPVDENIMNKMEQGIYDVTAASIAYQAKSTQQINDLNSGKVDKVLGKGLSANDYTNTDKTEVLKVVNKADITYVDTKVAAVNRSVKGTYATLLALTTALPSGDTGNYVVTVDGHVYTWNSSSWVDTGIQYQSTGIADGSVTTVKQDVRARYQYPFSKSATLYSNASFNALHDAIIDVKLYNADTTQKYYIRRILVDFYATHYYLIVITRVSDGVDVCQLQADQYTPPISGVTTVRCGDFVGSGMFADVTINWSKLANGAEYIMTNAQSDLDVKTLINSAEDKNANDILLSDYTTSYPFSTIGSAWYWVSFKKTFKDIKLYGANHVKHYYIQRLWRSNGGTYYILVREVESDAIVCRFYNLSYTEPTGVTRVSLEEQNTSGITGEVLIDWTQLILGNDYVLTSVGTTIDLTTYYIENDLRRWSHKNWMAIGDSITFRNQYQKYVQGICGFGSVTTRATSGIPLKVMDDGLAWNDLALIDVVTVFAPANDFGSSTVLGTINDAKTVDSFYGNMKAVIENILTIKPWIRLAFITTTYIGTAGYGFLVNSAGCTLKQYTEAMKQVCELYNVPILDLQTTSGLNAITLANFSDDSLHPNAIGMALIGKMIGNFLNTL